MSEWIKCDKGNSPPRYIWVLGWVVEPGGVGIYIVKRKAQGYEALGVVKWDPPVTHWMPLPEPPEQL